jgi:hypothetical protein
MNKNRGAKFRINKPIIFIVKVHFAPANLLRLVGCESYKKGPSQKKV